MEESLSQISTRSRDGLTLTGGVSCRDGRTGSRVLDEGAGTSYASPTSPAETVRVPHHAHVSPDVIADHVSLRPHEGRCPSRSRDRGPSRPYSGFSSWDSCAMRCTSSWNSAQRHRSQNGRGRDLRPFAIGEHAEVGLADVHDDPAMACAARRVMRIGEPSQVARVPSVAAKTLHNAVRPVFAGRGARREVEPAKQSGSHGTRSPAAHARRGGEKRPERIRAFALAQTL